MGKQVYLAQTISRRGSFSRDYNIGSLAKYNILIPVPISILIPALGGKKYLRLTFFLYRWLEIMAGYI